jgi:cysteine desulfurase family protein
MKDNYYLDNAATTWPKPEAVYRFMDAFFRSHGVNPGRAGHALAVEAEAMIVQTRRLLAEFFGFRGDPNRVVFTQNATDSLNAALFGLIEPGDHLIITRLEHNSVLRPANHLERDRGVAVTRIRPDRCGYVDPQDIREAITPKTRAVVVNHGSNVLGSLQDIEAIGRIVAETDAAFIVDSCQSAGVVAIDMARWGIDILAFTGHKGLFGPMGIGGMIVGDEVALRPARVGGTGVDSISPFQPDDYPFHLEAGTVSVPGIAGLNAAQKWFAELGRARLETAGAGVSHAAACRAALDHIAARERGHVERLRAAFEAMDDVVVYGPRAGQARVATLSVNLGGLPADQLGAMLDADHSVCVRAGLHCAPLVHEDAGTLGQNGAVRFSPGYFTDDEDIETAIEAVMDVAEFATERRVATGR